MSKDPCELYVRWAIVSERERCHLDCICSCVDVSSAATKSGAALTSHIIDEPDGDIDQHLSNNQSSDVLSEEEHEDKGGDEDQAYHDRLTIWIEESATDISRNEIRTTKAAHQGSIDMDTDDESHQACYTWPRVSLYPGNTEGRRIH